MHVYYLKKKFFSSQFIRISGNSINFNDKNIKISDFYTNKMKKVFNIDGIDVNEILVILVMMIIKSIIL